jgi:hypothetical protein
MTAMPAMLLQQLLQLQQEPLAWGSEASGQMALPDSRIDVKLAMHSSDMQWCAVKHYGTALLCHVHVQGQRSEVEH